MVENVWLADISVWAVENQVMLNVCVFCIVWVGVQLRNLGSDNLSKLGCDLILNAFFDQITKYREYQLDHLKSSF